MLLGMKIRKGLIPFLITFLLAGAVAPFAFIEAQPQGKVELISLRTRYSQTYQVSDTLYQSEFYSSPEFTRSNILWVRYVFTEESDHYKIQHPWASVEFYDYYTKVFNEDFSEVRIYDDRWVVEVQSFAGINEKWSDVGFWDIVRSYEIVPDGIKLHRMGQTTIGERVETYYFRDGSPCKIQITQYSDTEETIRYVWKPSGIVATTEREIVKDYGEFEGKTYGLRYYNDLDLVHTIRWYDELSVTDNITILTDTSAQGRKAEISFGNFLIPAGGSQTLDPETYNPDAHVEVNSCDGYAYADAGAAGVAWAVLEADPGDAANDFEDSLICQYVGAGNVNNQFQYLIRGLASFYTAALPDSAVIVSANISLYGESKIDNLSITPKFNIYSAAPASATAVVAGDFDSLGTTAYCDTDMTYAAWDTTGYNEFPLNATGRAAVSTTGVSYFGFRDVDYDVGAGTPAWVSVQTTNMYAWSSDKGAGFKPRLVVIYAVLPTVTSENATAITDFQATLTGNITSTAGSNCDERGFEWGILTGNYTDNTTESGDYGISSYTLNATGLSASTTYFWRAMAHNPAGWGYGSELSFNTTATVLPLAPTNLVLFDMGSNTINMSWTAGVNATHTLVRIRRGSYPTGITDGEQVYFDTATTANQTGLDLGSVTYYVRAWGYNVVGYSLGYAEASIGGNDMVFLVFMFLPLGLTLGFYFSRQPPLGFASGIAWFIFGTYSYNQSTAIWDEYYALFLFACLGMTVLTILHLLNLRRAGREGAADQTDEDLRRLDNELYSNTDNNFVQQRRRKRQRRRATAKDMEREAIDKRQF